MKKICISKNWHLDAPHFHGFVDLPNDYAVTAPRDPDAPGRGDNGYFVCGSSRYVKNLDIAEEPRHYILDVDGAYMCTSVRCNDYKIVNHPHGYTPLLVDLTPHLRFGESNCINISTSTLQPSTRWYSGAGLYRDVCLWEGGDIRIEPWDKFIRTLTTDSVTATYEISADRDAEVTLRAEVLDGGGHR